MQKSYKFSNLHELVYSTKFQLLISFLCCVVILAVIIVFLLPLWLISIMYIIVDSFSMLFGH